MFPGIDFEKVKEKEFVSNMGNKSVEDFYKTVDNYMKGNYLCDINQDVYFVRVLEDLFEVGFISWEDDFYYIKVATATPEMKIYNLDDILANRISEKERLIKEKIDLIRSKVEELKEEGVPFKLVKNSIKMNKEWY